MFGWIVDWFQDQKIAADFERVEAAARADVVKRLHAEHAIAALEHEHQALLDQVQTDEQRRFGKPRAALQRQAKALRQQISAAEPTLQTLERDYRAELDALYADLSAAKDEINELYAQKQAAYDDLNDARAGLDAWYSRSQRTYCFGNGGRELPTHSLFGQSLGDRAGLQGDRDDAYEEVQRCREAIAEAKDARQAIYEEIQDVKQARQEMFDLKRAGQSRRGAEQELHALHDALASTRRELTALEQASAAFTREQQDARGLPALQARLQAARETCAQAQAAYDAPSAVHARRQAHRTAWLRRHG